MSRQRARTMLVGVLSLFAFWTVIPFMAVKNWPTLFAFYGLLALGVVSALSVMRSGVARLPTLAVMTLIVFAFTRVAGPFVLTPVVATTTMLGMSAMPENRGRPWLVMGLIMTAVVLPYLLEYFGVINSTYLIDHGYLISRSDVFDMRSDAIDKATLIAANLMFIAVAGVLAFMLNQRRYEAQRQLHIQAWHLRQMLPASRKSRR